MNIPANYPGRIPTNETNPFAHDTMIRRVPETIDNILEKNPDFPAFIKENLQALSEDIQHDMGIPQIPVLSQDYPWWGPEIERRRSNGESWLNTDWFFAETYFYRSVIQAVAWWESAKDPFHNFKEAEYNSDALWRLLDVALAEEGSAEDRIAAAISRALWGNRIDLSYAESLAFGTTVNDDDLLINNTAAVLDTLFRDIYTVHLIADNVGSELAMDLVLIDTLLSTRPDLTVTLHLKVHPTFVSDATPADVWHFLDLLDARGKHHAELAGRLRRAWEQRRLGFASHWFWNSSFSMFDTVPDYISPTPIQRFNTFAKQSMVIIKGDANYRRLLGDAVWPTETPFADAVSYFEMPVLALRSLKSDPIVGLQAGEAEKLDKIDERWRINGKRGIIQFKP